MSDIMEDYILPEMEEETAWEDMDEQEQCRSIAHSILDRIYEGETIDEGDIDEES